MNWLRTALFAALLPWSLFAALPQIADPASDPAWRPLIEKLGEQTPRQATFEERRHFPFRKRPVVLTGVIRFAPGRGLSLSYLEPQPQTLIGDEQGVLLRDARGRSRSAPNDPRARAATSTLVDVLRFDVPALQKTFDFAGERDGDDWILQLVPRDSSLADSLGLITLTGRDGTLERIELARAANQRIEILIRDAREHVTFGEADLKRYFR